MHSNLRDHQLKIIIHMFLHMNLMVTIIQKSITDTYRKRVKYIMVYSHRMDNYDSQQKYDSQQEFLIT